MADHDAEAMGGGEINNADGGGIDVGGGGGGGGISSNSNTSPAATAEKNSILNKLFSSCSPDPRGSVHRAWGISLLFVVMYFALSIFESKFKLKVTVKLSQVLLHIPLDNGCWLDRMGRDGTEWELT
jgi:hypothetical protein